METTTLLSETIKRLFSEAVIEQHSLFQALAADRLNDRQIREAALQIYRVVVHFPRFLSALLTNIDDFSTRMPLVDNLYEEHGRLNTAYVHSETYKQFLLGIGVSESDIAASKPIIPVIAYNRAVTDLCLHHPFTEGLAALGVIEEIVARVSPLIGKFAIRHFSDKNASLFHFTSHETLDLTHSAEIYELAERNDSPENHASILRGLELGMYYHMRLYDDIFAHISCTNRSHKPLSA